jgi:hypothetical protein
LGGSEIGKPQSPISQFPNFVLSRYGSRFVFQYHFHQADALRSFYFFQFTGGEHARAEAHLSATALEDVVIGAALAAFPEVLVLGQFGEGDWLVAQFGIDFHHGEARGNTEDLGRRVLVPSQVENPALDLLGEAQLPEIMCDYEARIGYVFSVAPYLDVAETGELAVVRQGDDGVASFDFPPKVLGRPAGDTGAPLLGRDFEEGTDFFCIGGMCLPRNMNGHIHFAEIFLKLTLMKNFR